MCYVVEDCRSNPFYFAFGRSPFDFHLNPIHSGYASNSNAPDYPLPVAPQLPAQLPAPTGKMGENGGKWGKMGENGGKWGIIGGGRWKTYFLDHANTKKPAKMGTNHGCRFPSAPRFAIMWLVWSRLTPPPSDLSYCRGTQWGIRTAPCHTLTHPTKLSLVFGRLDMQQNKKCGAIEGSHCSGA